MTEDKIIHSPSGYTFHESQENGDAVDCVSCGDPVDDNYPFVNDDEGYLWHDECYYRELIR